MLFCPKCGAILTPRKDKRKTELVCSCGYSTKKTEDIILKEKVDLGKKIEVVDKRVEILPRTNEECPKCHHKEAFYWLVQTRAGDEAATRFFRCVKCNHTWRDYR